jgi:hypothetical protein
MTRARDVADTQDNIGGAVPPVVAGKNFIINGAMDIWQRGTSSFTNGGFTADRMISDNGATASRSTDAPTGFTYSIRWTTPGAANCVIRQGIELPAAGAQGAFSDGATFTFSIYAKSSVAGKALTLYAAFADGTNGTARRTVVDNVVIGTTTTSWARYTYTFTIPAGASISPAVCLQVTPYVTTPNADVYMTGMQVESGSVVTPFSRAAGTIQGELAACQRYYYRAFGNSYFGLASVTNYPFFGQQLATSSSQAYGVMQLPVPMRVYPTAIDAPSAGSFRLQNGSNYWGLSTLALDGTNIWASGTTVGLSANTGSGLTSNSYYFLTGNFASTAYIGVSAEL